MKRNILLLLSCLLVGGCGYLRNARVCGNYADYCLPDDEVVIMTTWPFHLAMLTGCAAVDQSITTAECLVPAGRDTVDYLRIKQNGNNIMFDRTVFIPKLVASPVIFSGSYLVRWLVPVEHDTRPFKKKP